jgi:predicted ArsR family transcriptional regulator
MVTPRFDGRFFESTRGKIVLLLRRSRYTVNDLAAELGLTDNAVRAHLLTLERDGLVMSAGTVKGFRKPHSSYKLTDDARHIFPKSYDSLLNRLLDAIKEMMPTSSLGALLREVGKKIAGERTAGNDVTVEERLNETLAVLENLGGAATATVEDGEIEIKSESCPFADTVSEHPEVCKIAESLVSEIMGRPANESCDRTSLPKCRFLIARQAEHKPA